MLSEGILSVLADLSEPCSPAASEDGSLKLFSFSLPLKSVRFKTNNLLLVPGQRMEVFVQGQLRRQKPPLCHFMEDGVLGSAYPSL